ncbi:MAG: carbohydrate binding domain-containing protein, partial [Patescibacteria group bacterium]|nr:carbohydrate binding domain-containing protein [Patescibacteria group bacterium]
MKKRILGIIIFFIVILFFATPTITKTFANLYYECETTSTSGPCNPPYYGHTTLGHWVQINYTGGLYYCNADYGYYSCNAQPLSGYSCNTNGGGRCIDTFPEGGSYPPATYDLYNATVGDSSSCGQAAKAKGIKSDALLSCVCGEYGAVTCLASTFVSQSVPTSMVAGQSYSVSITMTNNGARDWTASSGYYLGSQNPQGNTTWGISQVPMPVTISYTQTGTFTFTVTAPATAGTYNFQWQMDWNGSYFGAATTNVSVVVVAPTPTPTPTFTPTPTPTFTPTPTPTNTPTPTPTPITAPQNPYCDASGYIHNLNFGINDNNSWEQFWCGDVAIQNPSDNPLPPSGTTCGGVSNSYSNVVDTACIDPGIFFSGSSNPTFGGGSASSTNWIYPNYTGETGILPTAWQYLTDTAQINGITETPLKTASPIDCGEYSDCMVNQSQILPSGVYSVDTSNNTDPLRIGKAGTPIYFGTAASPKNYVFLVNGDMYIMGNLYVPAGSTATFSVKGNIYVDKSVGEVDTTSLNGDIQGFYSADKNFIVQSYQGIPQSNEVQNPSFETDTSHWYMSNGTITRICTTATDGSCSVDANVTTAGSPWTAQLQQSGIPVVAGVTYTVSFDAKADVSGKQFSVWMQQTNNPYTVYGSSPTYTLGTAWKHYTFSFSPTQTDQSQNLRFNFGAATGHYYVDNVQVTTNTTISRVQNSSFETSPLTPAWTFWTNPPAAGTLVQDCTTSTDGKCSAHVNVSAATPSTWWWVDMNQAGIPIFNGTTYTILFDAKASVARPIYVLV